MVFARPHARQDWISLELAKLAAARIRADPALVALGLKRIERWRSSPGANRHRDANWREWEEIIRSRSADEIAALLISETDEAQRLRSNHPFIRPPFILEQERQTIIESAFA